MSVHLFFKSRSFYILIFLMPFAFVAINHLFPVLSFFEPHAKLISHFKGSYFKQQLFKERLLSYNVVYNDTLPVCNKSTSLNDDQKDGFNKMSELLQKFRNEIVSCPKDYFYSRGIVLTAGPNQIKFARVNLKMIALTGTKLSVQVLFIYSVYFIIIS